MLYIYIIIFYLFFIVLMSTKPNTLINNKYINIFYLLNMIFISIYIIVITDLNYTDRVVYSKIFNSVKNSSLLESIETGSLEPLFIILVKFISIFTSELIIFYVLMHLLFLFILLKSIKLISSDTNFLILTLFIFINYTIYFGYTLNGLRQGFAIALLLLAIGYAIKDKKSKMIITGILAPFFHVTVTPLIVCLLIVFKFNKIRVKHLLIIYIVFSFFYLLDINSFLLQSITLTDFEGYTSEGNIEDFGGSNKLIYLLFNSFFLFLFLYCFKDKLHEKDRIYTILIKMYLITSIYLLMFGYIAYANRIASYSWFLIPILLGLVILKSNNVLVKMTVLITVFIIGLLTVIPTYII